MEFGMKKIQGKDRIFIQKGIDEIIFKHNIFEYIKL